MRVFLILWLISSSFLPIFGAEDSILLFSANISIAQKNSIFPLYDTILNYFIVLLPLFIDQFSHYQNILAQPCFIENAFQTKCKSKIFITNATEWQVIINKLNNYEFLIIKLGDKLFQEEINDLSFSQGFVFGIEDNDFDQLFKECFEKPCNASLSFYRLENCEVIANSFYSYVITSFVSFKK